MYTIFSYLLFNNVFFYYLCHKLLKFINLKRNAMKSKICVHGKSQSRTALGIINAYLKLHPDSTLYELQQAFPKSLNRKCSADHIIVPVKETLGHEKLFFEHEDELIVLKTGEKYALVEVWSKDDFNAICEHAKQYGIDVAEEGTKPFEKGSFDLEYLDEPVPPEVIATVPENLAKKKCKFKWWWLLLLILLLLIIIFCCKKCCSGTKPDHEPVEKTAPAASVTDTTDNDVKETDSSTIQLITDTGDAVSITLPDGKVLRIAKNSLEFKLFSFLNSSDATVDADQTKGWITLDKVRFETGKAILTPESETQLTNIAGLMQFFPNSFIKVGGYTDNTGTDELNMKISSERAKVAAEKIISSGIAANRVAYDGYGSQHPVCPANDNDNCRAANRRVDIRVTQK